MTEGAKSDTPPELTSATVATSSESISPDREKDPEPRVRRVLERGANVGARYLILDELGRGGMGVVYRAYDPELDRRIALKLIERATPESLGSERLLREAQALAQLSHPNVVAVYDVGTFGASVFMALELVEGTTLRAWLRDRPRTSAEILDVFLAAGEGLAAAHRAGIVHRDFKPANVLIGLDGRVRVADFGLARSVSAVDPSSISQPGERRVSSAEVPSGPRSPSSTPTRVSVEVEHARSDRSIEPTQDGTPPEVKISSMGDIRGASTSRSLPSSSRTPNLRSPDQLTQEGTILGTPQYMSPEQEEGDAAFALSDQYSFCVCLFEAFYGERPRRASDPQRFEKVKPRPGLVVSRRLRTALMRGLAARPGDRFPGMDDVLVELRLARHPPRSVWPTVAAGIAIVSALGLGYRAVGVQKSGVCQGGPTKMGTIWNVTSQAAMKKSFAASGVPYAEHTLGVVSSVLDRYTNEWASAYTDACEATRLRGEQSEDMLDRRMACLEQRRFELAAKTEILSRADANVIEKAAQTVESLAPVGECADLSRLAARVMPPDRETRVSVEKSWEELGRAKALLESGHYAEGEPLARSVSTQAETLHYRPLEADSKLVLAQFLDAKGEYPPAELTLRQALRAAQAGGVHDIATRAWIGLVKVVGVRLQHHGEAHQWALDAEAYLETLATPDATQGLLLSAESDLLYQEGKFEDAAARGEKAREVLERTVGPEAPVVAEVWKTIGNAQADLGKTEDARHAYERAREVWEKSLGSEHPAVAAAWNNLGTLLLEHESFNAALDDYRRALDIWQHSLGPDHPNVAIVTTNIGETLRALGDKPGAEAAFRSALSIRTRALGADHPSCAGNLANLGNLALDSQGFAEAQRFFEQAQAIWESRLGAKDQHVATALVGIGDALSGRKSFKKAIAMYERGLAIEEEALGKEHLYLVDPLAGLGQAYLGLGQYRQAREVLERALSLAESQSADPVALATIRLALAETLWQTGVDRPRARVLAKAARDGYAPLGPRGEHGAKKATEWIAMAK